MTVEIVVGARMQQGPHRQVDACYYTDPIESDNLRVATENIRRPDLEIFPKARNNSAKFRGQDPFKSYTLFSQYLSHHPSVG